MGGGYSFRLCPKTEALTEECFMRMPLEFVGSMQKLRWRNGTEHEIPATRTTSGTIPKGSMWTVNPIPACATDCNTPQFAPPPSCDTTCWGYKVCPGGVGCATIEIPAIVDRVSIPADLTPGEYVLGWRWDCEQTPQVWAGCGDITVAINI